MKLIELFQKDIIRLPIHQGTSNKSFRKELFDRLDEYKKFIDRLDFSELGPIHSIPLQIKPVKDLIVGIKESVELYLNGYPSRAFDELKKSFDMGLFSHLSNSVLGEKECIYRFRKQTGNYQLSQKELFHIPFHSRTKVDTQRYSIPGFPSLYAANSIYVAWEEMQRPPIDQLQAAKLTNVKKLVFFDLTTDIYVADADLSTIDPNELWKHLIVWPLIAACSVKVRDRNSAFKPEYIIPQLMLQIIRAENKWDGIRFSSTHIDRNIMKKAKGEFYNYVLPVKDNSDDGYCAELLSTFEMSDVTSWYLSEVFLKPTGSAFFTSGVDTTPYKIQAIEIDPDKPLAYQYSVFGTLEKALNSKPPKKISVL